MEEKKLTIPTWKIEDTLGWWQTGGNFYFGDNEKQGKLNAQVWTWAMAGIPKIETPAQQEQQTGKKFDLQHKSIELPEKQTTQQEAPATNTNTWSTAKTWAKNTTVQTQQTTQPEWFRENGVRYKDATDRNAKTNWAEFGWLQNALPKEETTVEEKVEEKTEEPAGQDVNVNTFLQWSTTELFGKMISWADTAPYDHNSIEWKKAEARLAQYQKINALSVSQLASNINSWSILAGWQAMRDLQTYNPEKYQQLQEYQKKEDSLNQINMIASGKTEWDTTLQDKTWESINNYLNETVANAGWNNLDRASLDEALSQNQWIINYAERMSYYSSKITELDQTIWDLEADARKKLGADVPEYMIQNYVNNRSKKLYKQRDNLMNQYNYYKGVYEAQVEQEATAWEKNYKERQLALQESNALRDQKMDTAKLQYDYDKLWYDYDKLYKDNIDMSNYTTSWEAGQWLQSFVSSIQDKINSNAKIRSGWCGTVVNDYLKSLGINFQYDDNKSTKLASRTTKTPAIWSIAIWDKTGTTDGDKYWHVAIVTGINGDGTITVLESNKNTGLRYHKYNQANVFGYYNPYEASNNGWDIYKQLKNWTLTYSNYIKKLWDNQSQEEKNIGIIQQAMNDVKNGKDFQNTFNWLRKVSAKDFYTGEMAQNTRYEMLNALAESDKESKEIMKIVKEWNDELEDDDDTLRARLAVALAGRYTNVDDLDNDLDVIWKKDKWYTTNKAKKIWNLWKEEWLV